MHKVALEIVQLLHVLSLLNLSIKLSQYSSHVGSPYNACIHLVLACALLVLLQFTQCVQWI